MLMQYTAIFHGCKNVNFQMKNYNIFLIFAQNIDCGYTLFEAVLTSTHNLCFKVKIRKNVYPCKPQVYYIKVGCKGLFVTRTCFHEHTRLTMYYIRALIYDFLYWCLYGIVLEALRSVLERLRCMLVTM